MCSISQCTLWTPATIADHLAWWQEFIVRAVSKENVGLVVVSTGEREDLEIYVGG